MAREFLEELRLTLASPYPYTYVLSFEEQRMERILRHLAGQMQRPLALWSATRGLYSADGSSGDASTRSPLRALEAISSAPDGTVSIFFDLHPQLDDPELVRGLRDRCESLAMAQKAIVLVSPILRLPPELEKEISVLDAPLPDHSELAALLDAIAAAQQFALDAGIRERAILAARGLTENEAQRAFYKALLAGGNRTLEVGVLVDEKRQILRKSEVLDFYEGSEGMQSVGGLAELKTWLRGRSDAFTERAREFGLPQPRGLLLLGVQGCGKSLTAKAVADLWKLPLIRLDLGGLFSARISAEENVRRAIHVAEALSPVVLWVDELEKGFAGARSDSGAEINRVLGSFLIWLQEKTKPVFVVATANDIEDLPPELLRKGRFDEIFFVDLPDVHEREEIISIHLQKRMRDPRRFDLKMLARSSEHFSGAELEQVVIAALYHAYSEKRELSTGDISKALEETIPLYFTYEERIKELRDWARQRARFASIDSSMLDLFEIDEISEIEDLESD